MKRFLCVLLVLCMLMGTALCENDRRQFESGYCFSLWYDDTRFAVDSWQDEERGLVERFRFLDENAAAYLEISSLDEAVDEEERWWKQGLSPMDVYWVPELDLALPWHYACYENEYLIVEEWIVTADSGLLSFAISHPIKDDRHWGEELFSILETVEFPPQPAVSADFRLDFFQGGAAGMRFTDLMVDEDAEPIVLIPLREMREFALEYLEWSMDTVTPTVAMTLYTDAILSPGTNLRVSCYFADVLPNLRVRYTDADGAAQCFYLFQSGRDGSLLLLTESEL